MCRKAEEAPTIPICKSGFYGLLAGALILPLSAAEASREDHALLSAYVQARAADTIGAADRASQGYAAVLALAPQNEILAARALGQAVEAGDPALAVRSARILEKAGLLAPDIRLLLLTEALRTRDWKAATLHIDAIEKDEIFAFMAPVLRAWLAFETGDGDPIAILDAAADDPIAGAYVAEHRPLILLAQGNRKEGVAGLVAMAEGGGGRASRLRIAGAAWLADNNDRKAAAILLQGDEAPLVAARALLEKREPIPGAIDGASAGIAEFLVRVAIDLHRQNVSSLALTYARLATFLAPENSETWLVTSEIFAAREQEAAALEVLAHIPPGDPFAAIVSESRIRLLVATGQAEKALADARAAVASGPPAAAEWTRLGDLYGGLKRLDEAAAAYAEALALARGQENEWALWLLRGGVLEQAGDWAEAKAALEAAYRLAPQQPIVLNYLGYAQLERRENIEEAMRLIAEASRLQPDSAEITDSLGWAHYLRGNLPQAIQLLEKAVVGQPADPAINEHLGDAYYSAGRRYEARYAWEAALIYAEDEDAARLRAKLETGLTPKLASP
ncbi:tetratricopeptide repeat protein [Enterovirga sp. GCM10030262]|uniref:tetratricopeptide repeat protein n=1 Tax=Enterovirga sp. GCM10030262 TaxID=3273391 RepID=UPI003606BE03